MKNLYTITRIAKRNGVEMNLSKVGFLAAVGTGKSDVYSMVVNGGTYETDSYIYVANK